MKKIKKILAGVTCALSLCAMPTYAEFTKSLESIVLNGGNEQDVIRWLDEGGKINDTNGTEIPLFLSVLNGNEKMVDIFVRHGANIDLATHNTKDTPLLYAFEKKKSESMIKLLIDKGADVTVTNKKGYTPLLFAKAYDYDDEIVKLLEEKGARLEDIDKNKALIFAADACDYDLLTFLVNALGANVNATTPKGSSVYQLVYNRMKTKETESAKKCERFLKRKGAVTTVNISKMDNYALRNMLSQAIDKNDFTTAMQLVQDKRAFSDDTSGDKELSNFSKAARKAYLAKDKAQQTQLIALLKEFLKNGYDVIKEIHTVNYGTTEEREKRLATFEFLIANKILDVNTKIKGSHNEDNLLLSSTRFKCQEMAIFLVNNGADVNYKNKSGQTSLTICAKYNLVELAQSLLDHNADVTIKYAGETALDIAKQYKSKEMVALLKKYDTSKKPSLLSKIFSKK